MHQKFLDNLKITTLNEMQLAMIDAAKKKSDIVLLSPTGSGKTVGFLLPLFDALSTKVKGVQALIVVPSRELAIQIEQVFRQMGTGFKVSCCYGGHSVRIEKSSFTHPPAVLVGTPGRIAYHLRNKNFDATTVRTLVLDEFDKSLELGFKEEMSEIIGMLNDQLKRILTSATKMAEIPEFTGVKNPKTFNFLAAKSPTTSQLKLKYIKAKDNDKLQILFSLLCKLQNKSSLIFCNHREAVDRVSGLLSEKGVDHGVFHGGMDQEDREHALIKFRNGSHHMLVTTDLASRGLDIPQIEAIIHYQLPVTLEVFTHRNGRTARMNAEGTTYILFTATEHLPPFIKEVPEEESLPEKNVLPGKAPWRTLYIGAGRKDKISKMDIVGLILQKGGITKEELGRVEVLDHASFAAVKSEKIDRVLQAIRLEKLKNRKLKFEIAR